MLTWWRVTVNDAGKVVSCRVVEKPRSDGATILAETYRLRRDSEERALRLSVLIEVQSAWQDAATNAAFTRWLAAELEALRGKTVA